METENTLKSENNNKAPRLKYKISIVVLLLIVITAIVFIFIEQNKPDAASAAVIRNAAAMQLGKDPNELTDEDFASMTMLRIKSQELCDIKLIKKFPNLETLFFVEIKSPKIPKWIKILSKTGLIDIKKMYALDLSPIEKLDKVTRLAFLETQVESYTPLLKLKYLKTLSIDTSIDNDDFELFKKLKNLKTLIFQGHVNITDKQINELRDALPETEVARLEISY